MSAKEFVKLTFPKARAERYVKGRIKGMQESYYLIWSEFNRDKKSRLGEGATESKAWIDAKNKIEIFYKSNLQ